MKNSKYLVIAIVTFLLIAGCKKKKPAADGPQGTAKACSNTIDSYIGTGKFSLTMFYDENRRLVKIKSPDVEQDYSYEQDKIKVSYLGNAIYEITLSNGRSTRISEIGKPGYQVLTYNSEGYLSTIADYSNNVLAQTVNLTYTNGNLTGLKTTFPGSAIVRNVTVDYSSDLSSARLLSLNPLNEFVRSGPIENLGKLSKNVVTKYSLIITSATGRAENVITYTYTKDGAGKFSAAATVNTLKNYNSSNQLTYSSVNNYDYGFNYGCD